MRETNRKPEKIETQMAPMIDIVFQLLIFFLLTLKIVEPEGDFNVNMPVSSPESSPVSEVLPDIKVTLTANNDGTLDGVFLNEVSKAVSYTHLRANETLR